MMEYKNKSVKDAAHSVFNDKLTPAGGQGGVIVLDRKGNFSFEFNTPGMYRGYLQEKGTPQTFIFK